MSKSARTDTFFQRLPTHDKYGLHRKEQLVGQTWTVEESSYMYINLFCHIKRAQRWYHGEHYSILPLKTPSKTVARLYLTQASPCILSHHLDHITTDHLSLMDTSTYISQSKNLHTEEWSQKLSIKLLPKNTSHRSLDSFVAQISIPFRWLESDLEVRVVFSLKDVFHSTIVHIY